MNFDPEKLLERLRIELMIRLGGYKSPAHRFIGPEMEAFLDCEVREALVRAYKDAELDYNMDIIKKSDEASRNVLNAVFAGMELAKRETKDK